MKTINGKQVNVIVESDRIQRAHHVMHNGLRLGCVATNKWTRTVWATKDTVVSPRPSVAQMIKHGERKEVKVLHGKSKSPAFNELERWVCGE